MKFEPRGEWMVGTPVIVAISDAAVKAAAVCVHPAWEEASRQVNGVTITILERCTSCKTAMRGRYRITKEGDSA